MNDGFWLKCIENVRKCCFRQRMLESNGNYLGEGIELIEFVFVGVL